MRIAVDVMGSDRGPVELIAGSFLALRKYSDLELLLVGDQRIVLEGIRASGATRKERDRIEIRHASQVIEMSDKVASLRAKPDASLVHAVESLREGRARALVAVGNTAATVAITKFRLKTLQGVPRAGIAVPLPSIGGPCVIIDAGANTKPQPKHLAAYGLMASCYAERVLGVSSPRVGLLNVGSEIGKGNDFLLEVYQLLSALPINFAGNLEGRDIFGGEFQVAVCDGFVGNAVLKSCEGMGQLLMQLLGEELGRGILTKIGATICHKALRSLKERMDYAHYGGAPLLGVKGTVIIGHGHSDAMAVSNAVRVARESVISDLNEAIVEGLSAGSAELNANSNN